MAAYLSDEFDSPELSGGDLFIPFEVSAGEGLRLRLFETVIHNCPAHFFIAFAANGPETPAWTRAWQASGGRGLDRAAARRAAIWEAIERACAMTGGPDDPRPGVSSAPLETPLEPNDLWKYSTAQLHNLKATEKDSSLSDCGWPVDNLWVSGRHLTRGGGTALPATAVLCGEDLRLGLREAPFSSSTGIAARDTREGAAEHATLELVERDCAAIWWYNRLAAPRVDRAATDGALGPALARWLGERRRLTWHLLLPHDLPAATVVALSATQDGRRPAIGVGAALDPERAVLSATLEMLQGEIALSQMRAAQQAPDPPPPPPLLAWSEATDALAAPELAGSGATALPPARGFQDLKAAFDEAGIDVFLADLTRPELGVPVVRAVSPQLRDWHPRFAPGRLFDVPVALGLRAAPAAEAELNPVPFVI